MHASASVKMAGKGEGGRGKRHRPGWPYLLLRDGVAFSFPFPYSFSLFFSFPWMEIGQRQSRLSGSTCTNILWSRDRGEGKRQKANCMWQIKNKGPALPSTQLDHHFMFERLRMTHSDSDRRNIPDSIRHANMCNFTSTSLKDWD